MKKALSIAAVAALVAAAVSISVYVNSGRNEMDDLFYANIEALANDEGVSVKECYTKIYGSYQSYTLFCDDKTSTSTIYSCGSESWGTKGVSSLCVSR